jgi:ectoine hydroxylase-related dioxygenase (phytanoyl-CoA dioxygenase family)
VDTKIVTSNGKTIPFDECHFTPMRDSAELLNNGAALRERFRQDGYLLVRSLLDSEKIRWLREKYFQRLPVGFLKEGTAPAEGVFSGTIPRDTVSYGISGHAAFDFVRSAEFRQLAEESALLRLTETLLEGPTQILPRQIVRHFHSGSRRASRAHTDFEYMKEGADRVVTTWIPLGDCTLEMGGLVYLEGSEALSDREQELVHEVNDRPDDKRPLSHDLSWTSHVTGRRWLWTNYSAGDVAVHGPRIVHASLDTTSDVMRLSADLRFQRHSEKIDPKWTKPWSADDGA